MAEPRWAQRMRMICLGQRGTVEPAVTLNVEIVLRMLDMLRDARKVMTAETPKGNRPRSVKRWYLNYKWGPRAKENNDGRPEP